VRHPGAARAPAKQGRDARQAQPAAAAALHARTLDDPGAPGRGARRAHHGRVERQAAAGAQPAGDAPQRGAHVREVEHAVGAQRRVKAAGRQRQRVRVAGLERHIRQPLRPRLLARLRAPGRAARRVLPRQPRAGVSCQARGGRGRAAAHDCEHRGWVGLGPPRTAASIGSGWGQGRRAPPRASRQ